MPTYDFRCPSCDLTFEVFRPMEAASEPAFCPEDGTSAVRSYVVGEAFLRDRAPVRVAQVRKGSYQQKPGTIVDHIVTGDGMAHHRQTERDLLQAAKESGVPASDDTIVLKGPRTRRRSRGLVSFPGRPARQQTRDEAGF